MMRFTLIGCVLLAGPGVASAAEDLQPAVDTSAPAPAAGTASPTASPTAPPATPARAPNPAPPRMPAPAGATSPAAAAPGGAKPAPAGAAQRANTVPSAAGTAAARSSGAGADRVELENTQITGNRELPKVMYVVPWKKPDLGSYGGRPAKSLLDELLEPVDRDVFRRQNSYFDALQPDAAAPAAGDEK